MVSGSSYRIFTQKLSHFLVDEIRLMNFTQSESLLYISITYMISSIDFQLRKPSRKSHEPLVNCHKQEKVFDTVLPSHFHESTD